MNIAAYWEHIVTGKKQGLGASLARIGLSCLAGLYYGGLWANLALYEYGVKRRTRPALPTISVGNLTLGGTGKTTAVRYLAKALSERGIQAGIVLRGYGGRARANVLASDGRGHIAALPLTGDEAQELARALPHTPIVIGARREKSIAILHSLGAALALLDDGYQYFRMERDLNIVLISALFPAEAAHLFPRGFLREPWTHLRRADQLWITHADLASAAYIYELEAQLHRYAPDKPVIVTQHRPQRLKTPDGKDVPLESLRGRKMLVVSGLGCPESFEHTVRQLGAQLLPVRFPDHHIYSAQDYQHIRRKAEKWGAEGIVTTGKDAVKISALLSAEDFALPLWILQSELAITRGEDVVAEALEKIIALVPKAL